MGAIAGILQTKQMQVSLVSSSTDKSHHSNGTFVNPWSSYDPSYFNIFSIIKWKLTETVSGSQSDSFNVESIPLDLKSINDLYNGTDESKKMMLTWLGHAAILITTKGLNVLFDPCFSDRCSPLSFAGPKRFNPLPFQLDELPTIDVIVISHNHYDHLDLPALHKIINADTITFVPLGVKNLLTNQGFQNIIECDWWDEYKVTSNGKLPNASIACTPCQHFSSRSLFDRNETLWSSWVLSVNDQKFYFAGDTGYKSVSLNCANEASLPVCPEFKNIGIKYGVYFTFFHVLGPFDFAAIPIGAYNPRHIMSPVHLNSDDAVCVHKDIKSKKSIGMHWGTFKLTSEPPDEPPIKLLESLKEHQIPLEDFIVLKIGESISK